jgi:hypothetical protein
VDLTVKVTELYPPSSTPASRSEVAGPLLTCDRCHNFDEIVVAIMQILQLEETWALCGPCRQELPIGFRLI